MPGKQRNKKEVIRLVAMLLITLYAIQVFNYSFYLHTHMLDQGKLITHAHPYNKNTDEGPVKEHKHTWNQILILETLDFIFPLVFLVLALIGIERGYVYLWDQMMEIRPACITLHRGRAPPIS